MNNKGFTLVELLAVIVILTSMSLVAVASISSSLERRDVKECEEQIELAKNAAKIYFSLNDDACDFSLSDYSCEVSISTLKNEKYFNEISKTNKLRDDDQVKFTADEYKFIGTGECKQKDS